MSPPVRPVPALARVLAVAIVAMAVSACGYATATKPLPTPADFPGIAGVLARQGVAVEGVVSGDPGCEDRELGRTAIRFTASGLDQQEPRTLYLYIFRNRDVYERLRTTVDVCARSFVADPATFESIDTSPYVLAGQGPWAPEFGRALRQGLVQAAGTGG